MLGELGSPTVPSRRERAGSSAAPILVAIACFAVVLGVLFFANTGPRTEPTVRQPALLAEVQPARQAETPSAEAESLETPPSVETQSRVATVEQASPPANSSESIPAEPAVTPAQARLQRLQAQLEAGEFGPAMETAATAQDAIEKSQLLQRIADAQMEAGEFDGALMAIGRIPIPERRREARGRRASRVALAGGSGADFTQLIDLIQNETSGGWEDFGDGSGTITEFETGVRVDPNGLLYRLSRAEQTGRLEALGVQARQADLNDDMARASSLRLVSLTRLEKAIAARLADGQPVPETMQQFAGLSQIRYVFVYPDSGEIVIGGPAEGWRYNENGLPLGVESGRPTLQLDDFVTVLRTFSPGGVGMFNCLIVPRQEGLKAVREFVSQSNAGGPLRPGQVSRWVEQLQQRLGLQDVEVGGVPPESRVARVIVEADYRMKLIGVGKLDGGPEIRSFFDLLPADEQAAQTPLEALRWWLTMKYDAVLHSPDHDVFEIRGSSVLCQSENEFITAQGKRVHTGKAEETNRRFAHLFTEHYAGLAQRDTVFADLRNIFDLALVAALIRHERMDERVDWDTGVFAPDAAFRPAEFEPARTVMTVAGHRVYGGKNIVAQVAGGVRGDLMSVLKSPRVFRQMDRLANLAVEGRAPKLPEGRWWWDAAK